MFIELLSQDLPGFKQSLVERLFPAQYPEHPEQIQSQATGRWTIQETSSVYFESQAGLPPEIDSYTGTYEIPDLTVMEYTDVSLVGYMPVGLCDSQVIPNTVQRSRDSFHHHLVETIEYNGLVKTCVEALRSRISTTQPRQLELVFPLVCTNGYYHWLLEYLPRIRALDEYQRKIGSRPTVLVRPDPPRWMEDTLEELGIGPSCRQEWNGRIADVERLVTCTHHVHYKENFEPDLSAYQWLRKQLVDSGDPSFTASDRVYISRNDAATRRVRNESKLMEALEDRGFERHILSKLTFGEQIQLFQQAETIVGPHGAGLVNILFGDSLSVVELFPETMIEPYYYLLATILGHDYRYGCYPTIGGATDINVDVDDVIHLVDEITERSF